MAIARGWWKKIGSSFDWGYFLMNILFWFYRQKIDIIVRRLFYSGILQPILDGVCIKETIFFIFYYFSF